MKYSVVGYLVTFGFVTLSTVISEFAQIVSHKYDKPFIIRYVNDSSNIFGLLIPFIWLCTTKLFEQRVKKDREKLRQKKSKRCGQSPLIQSTASSVVSSAPYQYHGSPLGMGVHPINDPPALPSAESLVSDLGGSLFFNQSVLPETAAFQSPLAGVSDVQSLNGAATDHSLDSNQSVVQKWTSFKAEDYSSLDLNKTNEFDAFSRLISHSSNSCQTQQKRQAIPIVKLHLFHPTPAKRKRYKNALKHVHSTVHIALVKGHMLHFVPFLLLVSWFYSGGGMLWYLSLTGTTVPTNTCLARFRVLFVFFLSAVFFNESINLWKLMGIFFAFSSVALFAIEIESQKKHDASSTEQTHDTLWGAILILLAALLSALGDVVYRIGATKTLNNDKIYGLPLIVTFFFNGLYGLVILSTFWFIFYIEPFVMPNTADIYWIVGVSVVLMFANVVQFISISLTSPFFLNVCLFLKIPLSFVIDIFVHDYAPGLYSISGGVLVIIGFLMLEIVSAPKWCGKCKHLLEYPWCKRHIQNVRKRTQSFNVDIEHSQ